MGSLARLVRVALAWSFQRVQHRVEGVTGVTFCVTPCGARWCSDDRNLWRDLPHGVERSRVRSVERLGPVVLVHEIWYDGPSLLYVLRADREVTGDVADSMRREASRG